MNILKKFALIFSVSILLNSCGGGFKLPKPGDARNIPSDGRERARKNLEEGRGVKAGDLFSGNRKTNYEFSTSNPLWRAAFDVIDFMPLVTVDYSGGMIITDWYTDSNTTNDSLKFTIRFLSNDIRSDGIKIIVHRKICNDNLDCTTTLMKSNSIESELRSTILKKAALFDRADKKKK